MSFSDLATVGNFVSGIAVLISLIYLGVQIRQAAKNQRGTMHQMRAALSTDAMLRISESGLSNAFRAGLTGASDITEPQFWQYFYAANAVLRTTENAFSQYCEGLISEQHFDTAKASARVFLANRGFRALWRVTRKSREERFRGFMDQLEANVPDSPSVDLFEAWKSALNQMSLHSAEAYGE